MGNQRHQPPRDLMTERTCRVIREIRSRGREGRRMQEQQNEVGDSGYNARKLAKELKRRDEKRDGVGYS